MTLEEQIRHRQEEKQVLRLVNERKLITSHEVVHALSSPMSDQPTIERYYLAIQRLKRKQLIGTFPGTHQLTVERFVPCPHCKGKGVMTRGKREPVYEARPLTTRALNAIGFFVTGNDPILFHEDVTDEVVEKIFKIGIIQFLKVKNVGRKTVIEIRNLLSQKGFDIGDWNKR